MIRNLISLTLFIGLAKASVIPKENPTICVALHCFMETGACWADSECYAILDCLQVKRTMGSTHGGSDSTVIKRRQQQLDRMADILSSVTFSVFDL